jgi:hypothetical protein
VPTHDLRPTRRRLLAAATAVAVAGCSAGGDDGTTTPAGSRTGETGGADDVATTTVETTTAEREETTSAAPGDADLDLREANVTAVAVRSDGGDVRFDVALYHDDDGEDGYANWWQVEALDGTRLGRRDLLHAHGTREFTRSATVSVPEGATCVVVRGHDQTHGYGGRAMLVNLDSGATRPVEQGPEPRAVDGADCP